MSNIYSYEPKSKVLSKSFLSESSTAVVLLKSPISSNNAPILSSAASASRPTPSAPLPDFLYPLLRASASASFASRDAISSSLCLRATVRGLQHAVVALIHAQQPMASPTSNVGVTCVSRPAPIQIHRLHPRCPYRRCR